MAWFAIWACALKFETIALLWCSQWYSSVISAAWTPPQLTSPLLHFLSFKSQLSGPNFWGESTPPCSDGTWVPTSIRLTVLGWDGTHLSPAVHSLSLYAPSRAWNLEAEQLKHSWHLAVRKEPKLPSHIWASPFLDCVASSTLFNFSVFCSLSVKWGILKALTS